MIWKCPECGGSLDEATCLEFAKKSIQAQITSNQMLSGKVNDLKEEIEDLKMENFKLRQQPLVDLESEI